MLEMSDLPRYFRELRELSRAAAQFLWNAEAGGFCLDLSKELKRLLTQWEAKDSRAARIECFCREMLAECFPDDKEYYLSQFCLKKSTLKKQAWFAYSALQSMGLDHRPQGVSEAILTVCASITVACTKMLKQLEAAAPSKALPPEVHLPLAVTSAARPAPRRQAGLYIIAGTDAPSPPRR